MVTLKNVCHLGEKGLLTPILRRTWAGAADVTVFELKVRALRRPGRLPGPSGCTLPRSQ